MARATKTTLKGITLRGNVYQARLTIPKDARDSLGLTEFTQSLETSDFKVAATRGEICIRGWKRKISSARGIHSPISEAMLWKEDLDKANQTHLPQDEYDYPIEQDLLIDRIYDIEAKEGYEKGGIL